MHKGSCLCQAVQYEIRGELQGVGHCHCSMCRKAHGAAFGSYGNARHADFRFTKGADAVVSYRSSAAVIRTFCRHCGATLQWYSEEKNKEWVSVTLGTLDTFLPPPPQKHIFVGSKASWYEIKDDLPQHEKSG